MITLTAQEAKEISVLLDSMFSLLPVFEVERLAARVKKALDTLEPLVLCDSDGNPI